MFLFGKLKVFSLKNDASVYGPGIYIFNIKSFLGDMTIFTSMTPIDAFSYKVTALCYSSLKHAWFAKLGGFTFLINLFRDKKIWDTKKFVKTPIWVKEEKSIKDARTWFSRFYSPNSKTFKEARNTMNW